MTKHLLSINDLSRQEINGFLSLAQDLKKRPSFWQNKKPLAGRNFALIFEKPSLRTRASFEVGINQFAGNCVCFSDNSLLGTREPIKDLARTISQYFDGVVIRTFEQNSLIEFTRWTSIPIINALSDFSHPCQILADIFTIQDKGFDINKIKIGYIGDGNNIAHSWLFAAGKLGLNLYIASPLQCQPNKEVVKAAKAEGKKSGANILILNDPFEAVKNADVVYTDVWASMGKEKEIANRRKIFKKFQINSKLLKTVKNSCLIMHCLPAHRGEEITDEVLESKNSIVFEQAKNRLYLQQALILKLLKLA